MNKKGVYRLLFLVLLAVAIASSYPIYRRVNALINSAAIQAIKQVEEAASIKVSYAHLSPAILWNVNVRSIVIADAVSGKELVSVRSVSLRYSLYRILRCAVQLRSPADMVSAFHSLVIDGVNIEIDDGGVALVTALQQRVADIKGANISLIERAELSDSKDTPTAVTIADTVRAISEKLQLTVSVRRVSAHYLGRFGEARLALGRVLLRKSWREGNIRLTMDGEAQVATPDKTEHLSVKLSGGEEASLPAILESANASASFKADVTLRRQIDDSTALLRMRDIQASSMAAHGTVAMKSINILTHYDKGVVTVETIQPPLPLSAKCVIDTVAGNLFMHLQTAKLPFNRVFSPMGRYAATDAKGGPRVGDTVSRGYSPTKDRSPTLDAALQSTLTTDTEVTVDFGTKSIPKQPMSVAYHSTGAVVLPDALTRSGIIEVQYALMGDGNQVRLPRMSALGPKCNIEGNAVYAFAPMQLSGALNVHSVLLPDGTDVAGYFTFNPIKADNGQRSSDRRLSAATGGVSKPKPPAGGFAVSSPQVKVADGVLEALQVQLIPQGNGLDFTLKTGAAGGNVAISGSAAAGSVLASVEIQQCFLDGFAAFTSGHGVNIHPSAMDTLRSLMVAGEAYISIDKDGLSYNVPYALVANTQKENQALYISLDGNGDTINVSQLDIAYGNTGANITAHVERDGMGGAFFTLETIAAMGGVISTGAQATRGAYRGNEGETAVPYHFSGSITGADMSGKRLLTVSDEYGSMLQASFGKGEEGSAKIGGIGEVTGSLSMASFPIRLGKGFLSLSTQTGFAWNKIDGIAVKINQFQVAGDGSTSDLSPRFMLSGEVTKYGAFFDRMTYTDAFSALEGSSSAFFNMNEGIFDSAILDFNLYSELSGESITARCEITNPDAAPLSLAQIKDNFFFNTSVQLKSFALSRFVTERSDNNTLTAALDATGTLSNPYISLDITRASVMFAGTPIVARGKAFVIDQVLTVADTHVSYGQVNLTDISADFRADTFTGSAQAMLDIGVDKSLFSMPLSFSVADTEVSGTTHLPISFTASLDTDGATGAFLKEPFPFNVTVMRSEHETAIFSSDNLGISGYLVDGGDVNIASNSELLVFNLTGKNDWENLDLMLSGLSVNAATIASHFNNDKFAMYRGVVTGNVAIGGIRSDPDFMGELALENADFSLLKVVPYHITGDRIPMLAVHSEINIPETPLYDKGKSVFLSGKIMLDRWMFDNVELFVRTPIGATAPALLDIGMATFNGDASLDLTVAIDHNKTMEVTGDVYVENTRANVRARELMSMSSSAHTGILNNRIDVDITMGPHVFVTLDPILRALLTPKSMVNFKMEDATESFAIKGDVGIKSGDIAWFNRSFYLKDGFIRFNDNEDSFDPIITLKAETRDRDDDGRDVKIIMNATNQPLSQFSPRFSSVPVKSEAEIRAMLGQIAVGMPGDGNSTASDVMLSMGDFAVAATVGRAVENTIRNIFNFDIFSIRTTALQNVFKSSINNDQANNNITAGNLLDNSTVYIGKYIGSVIYLDAMLRLSYDEHKDDNFGTNSGILFQPEIGFELEAPFAGIRWSMTPDAEAMRRNQFLPLTSVTLSWGFSF